MEGYLVWLDKQGKWHSSHEYTLSQFNLDELFKEVEVVQAWQIPLPSELPPRHEWFARQRAIRLFRGKAKVLARRDFKEHSLHH